MRRALEGERRSRFAGGAGIKLGKAEGGVRT